MEFETLKIVLLLSRLDGIPKSELHHLVIDAADSAAVLVRATRYPGLLFPCLFAERADVALQQEHVRNRSYWEKLDALAASETPGI